MTHLVLERSFDPPLTVANVQERVRTSGWCFDLHRVNWHGSFLSIGGRQLVCSFESADAESVRIALRMTGTDMRRLWTASVHEASSAEKPNVLVERAFDAPVAFERVHALEESKDWCLAQHRVQWVRSYLSSDGRRMLCLYRAPDAESVRRAQHEAGLEFDALWSFERVGLDTMPAA
jgi:hypothetical protein